MAPKALKRFGLPLRQRVDLRRRMGPAVAQRAVIRIMRRLGLAAALFLLSTGCGGSADTTLQDTSPTDGKTQGEAIGGLATKEPREQPTESTQPAEGTEPPQDAPSSLFLDRLQDACAGGDWQACDDLYSESPAGSEYEAFGETCGNRVETEMWCVDYYNEDDAGDADLGELWDDCAAGDWDACDRLYLDSPVDSAEEAFGATCGNRVETDVWCVDWGTAPGDDPALDELWVDCGLGDWVACDDLYLESPLDSDYETFGATCGYRVETEDWCVELYAPLTS
jgi:hypothetical protein